MKNYFVIENATGDILGFNLTVEEKDVLFYHKDSGNDTKSSTGRSYGAVDFKIDSLYELKLMLILRKQFKENRKYSYVILNSDNEWLSTGKNETEKTFFDEVMRLREDNELVIFETSGYSTTI